MIDSFYADFWRRDRVDHHFLALLRGRTLHFRLQFSLHFGLQLKFLRGLAIFQFLQCEVKLLDLIPNIPYVFLQFFLAAGLSFLIGGGLLFQTSVDLLTLLLQVSRGDSLYWLPAPALWTRRYRRPHDLPPLHPLPHLIPFLNLIGTKLIFLPPRRPGPKVRKLGWFLLEMGSYDFL